MGFQPGARRTNRILDGKEIRLTLRAMHRIIFAMRVAAARTCITFCRLTQVHVPSANDGLRRVYAFSTFMCRCALTTRAADVEVDHAVCATPGVPRTR